jgi:hypothetical protein
MKLKQILTGLVTLALFSSPLAAQADDWFLIATSDETRNYYFIDRASINVNDSMARVFVFVVYSKPLKERWVGYTYQAEYSCNERKSRMLRINDLDMNGSVFRSEGDKKWEEVKDGSISELIRLEVCPS